MKERTYKHRSRLKRRKNIKKGDLIDEVSKVVKTKKDAQAAEDCVLPSITKVLEKGDVLASRRTHLERMASNGTIRMKLGDVVRMRIALGSALGVGPR